jgi:TP901 family phage tail tape measure protein
MPGETLTLDLVANDQASAGLNKVADQTERLSLELQGLIKATRRLEGVFKAQKGVTVSVINEETKLTRARTGLTRATNKEIAEERKLTAARAKSAKETREAELGGKASIGVLNQLSGGLAGNVAQYGALGVVTVAAAGGVAAFGAAVDVSAAALRLQAQLLTTAVTQALAFEQEITRVTAVVGGGAGAFEKLRAAALAGGASTLFTAQQAAEALRFLAQAGLSANEASAALPGSLQLAAAGSLDLATAADIATNVMSGFKLGVEGINRVNDVLVTGANKSNTNVRELGTAFSYASGIAKSTGNELEDVAAVFAVLANNGIKASRAGTAVATGITRLQKPTPEAAAALERLGISLKDAEGNTKPLTVVLKELELAGAKTADVITIFGQVAGGKLITVLNAGTKELDKFARQFRNSAGAAEDFQRILQDTASAQVQIFQSTLETLSITIGSEFLPNVKGVSQALTEQAAIALNNNQVIGEFAVVSDAATQSLANLLRISAEIVPPFIKLGGAVLVLGENLDKLKAPAEAVVQVFAPSVLTLVNLADAAGQATNAFGLFSDTQGAANDIAEETRQRLLGAADAVGKVDADTIRLDSAILRASITLKQFGVDLGFIKPNPGMKRLQQFNDQLAIGFRQAAAAARELAGLTGGAAVEDVSPELAAQRELAKLDADLASSRDARKRAEIAYERELLELKGEELDDEIRISKERAALGKLEAALLAADQTGQKSRVKARKEDITGKLRELEIQRQLITTTSERTRIELSYEQTIIRINSSQDKQALKDAQINVARVQFLTQLSGLETQRAAQLREIGGQLNDQRGQMGEISKLELVSLQTQQALADLAAERGLDDAVRAERERLILLQAQVKTADALREIKSREVAREASFTAVTLASMAERQGAEAEIQRLQLESADRRRQIEADEQDTITRNNKLLLERLTTEAQIASVRTRSALAQTDAVRTGVRQGVGTDTQALQTQFATEADADLARKIAALEVAKQQAEINGLDATFLERRIEGLRAEAEAERAVAEATIARIEATGQLAAGVTDLGTRLADVARLGFDSAAGYEATAAAISTAAGLGGALAQGLGVSAKTAAKIQAAFNAAAAIGSFAAYAASGFTAANFLTSSIQYGIAAAKFGVIAGVSSGAGAGRGGGGGGGGGASGVTAPAFNAAAERDKTAQAFAKALRDQLEKPVQNVINLDFRRATLLESTPAVGREISSAVGAAQASVYQSGQRGSR